MSMRKVLNKLIAMTKASYKGFKIGDMVVNTNKACMHYGSVGEVVKIENLPENSGYLIHYKVINNGGTFSQGDILKKTEDQLSHKG